MHPLEIKKSVNVLLIEDEREYAKNLLLSLRDKSSKTSLHLNFEYKNNFDDGWSAILPGADLNWNSTGINKIDVLIIDRHLVSHNDFRAILSPVLIFRAKETYPNLVCYFISRAPDHFDPDVDEKAGRYTEWLITPKKPSGGGFYCMKYPKDKALPQWIIDDMVGRF